MPPIRAVALDVDGVLTDGGFWWGEGGSEMKRFHYLDVMGISRAVRSGMVVALISGEDSPLVDRYARKLGIKDVYKGCKDKANALRDFSERHGIPLSEICFMGDDINDLDAMQLAGLAAAPSTAHESVLKIAGVVTRRTGGSGAVRELLDWLAASEEPGEAAPMGR